MVLKGLERIKVERKLGHERFHAGGKDLDHDLLDFWQWCTSDLVENTLRGVLAEYIVACDLGLMDILRCGYASYDFITEKGIKVEVKSAAYLQSWGQSAFSPIGFSISPTTYFEGDTGKSEKERKRQSDVYVFALLFHKDKATLDPLNVEQWEFFVLPTAVLNEKLPSQERISFDSLKRLNPAYAKFGQIKRAIEDLFRETAS